MTRHRFSIFGRLAVVSALFLFLATTPLHARSWRITRFNASITIDKRGKALVTEHLNLLFEGEYHGIYRRVPIHYPGPHGENYTLVVRLIEATMDGQKLQVESSRRGDFREWKIYIPGAVDTKKSIDITYEVPNGIRWFPDYDEFYWNVTGNDWPVPIDAAEATIFFPDGTTGLKAQAYTGVYGSRDQDATSEVNAATIHTTSSNPLPMRGGLTVDIYIPKGQLRGPNALESAGFFIHSNPVVLTPLLALLVMAPLWWLIGKDPDPGRSVAPQYGPPQQMSPAEVGALVDDSVDPRDITSTIVDLAVRGYLRIDQGEEKGLLFKSKTYTLHRLEKSTEGLAQHELIMVDHLFDYGDTVSLEMLKNRFYVYLPKVRSAIMDALKDKHMYRVDPASGTAYMVGAGIGVGLLTWLVCKLAGVGVFDSGFLSFLCLLVAAAIVFLFGRQMTAKSFLGAQTWVHIKGFQEFMDRVDRDRLKTMPPDTFEKFLPYAMALGVELHWAKAFAGLLTQPPSWFTGAGYGPNMMFDPVHFTSGMSDMASSAHDAFATAPRASSSGSGWSSDGGSSGGGFSGGGFGGGGGDAF